MKTPYATNAGFRAARKSKSVAGAVYVLYDGRVSGMDTADGRWQTVCELHGTICSHSTLFIAVSHLSCGEWCEECQGTTPPDFFV
jgi:hypothetical protein